MKPTVLLDVDGVLADFVTAYLALVYVVTGRRYTSSDVTTWNINEALGIDAADGAKIKRAVGNEQALARALLVYPGAIDGVARIRELADVYIVTSPWNSNPTWTHDREHWLKKHFDIGHEWVIHTSAKHLVRGDVFVDDKTSTCRQWKECNPDSIAVRWETPHNRGEAWNRASTNDWSVLERIVEQAAEAIATRSAQ